MDAGVSFCSVRRADGTTLTVISNTTEGAWPMRDRLSALVDVDAA